MNGRVTVREPFGLPVVGHIPWFVFGSALPFLRRTRERLGPVFRVRFGRERCLVAGVPAAVRHVLIDNAVAYEKGSGYDSVRLLLGNGLVTVEGVAWRRQRSVLAPAFSRGASADTIPAVVSSTQVALARWTSGDVDMTRLALELSLDVAGRVFFATDLGEHSGLGVALDDGLKAAGLIPPLLPMWLPTRRNRQLKNAIARLDRAAADIAASESQTAVLTHLTNAHAGTKTLRDEIVTLVFAGHETTAGVLTWTLLLLAHHPDVQAALRAEVMDVLGDREPTAGDLSELRLLAAVVEESMRLFPPIWWIERRALSHDDVAGVRVEPGDVVGFCTAILQRDPSWWRRPHEFVPERFLAGGEVPRFAFLPFGAGHRTCVGATLARTQLVAMLALICRELVFEATAAQMPEEVCGITMRPQHARLRMHRRQAARGA